MDHKINIIKNLQIMRDEAKNEGGMFQMRAYDKVIKNISNILEPITSYEQIENIEGAGKNIKLKFKEIIETGSLKAAEHIIYQEKTDIKTQLLNVYGIGPKKAKDLIENHNIKSINDLKKKSDENKDLLTEAQKIGLICYYDLLERIPRKEMLLHKKILNIPKNNGEIVGSFRRKEESSGDIDVMLNMNIEEFNEYIENLLSLNYLKYILARGDKKLLGICSLPDGKYRRLDLIRNSKEEYPYMILYFTGSAKFNVAFRQHCLDIGLSLNEHSFTPKVDGLKTEKDIFKHVGLKYVNPENRIDSSCLEKIN